MNASVTPAGSTPAFVPVAIYTRVSTENQVGGRFDSCESQLAICREHILKNNAAGWVEAAHYSDPAFSGSTMNRPGLKALMRHIETGSIKVVLIFKLERMSRNIDEWGPFRNFLKKHGCRLESATEDISEHTPSGRLKNNLMLSFSQYERENTAEKTLAKMEQQARRGYWNGGAVPFGYAYDKNTQSLQPHPTEAPIVRRVFEEAAKLQSFEKIADTLNGEGLRTRSRIFRRSNGEERTVGAKRFRSDSLRFMVRNPVYRGTIRYAGAEHVGKHEPLVSADVWDRANAAAEKTIRPPDVLKPDEDKHFNLLKGLLTCGSCQRAFIPHASGKKDEVGKPYRYYYCNRLIKERGDYPCAVRRIPAASLENAVVQFLSRLGQHPDIISAAVNSSKTRRHGQIAELQKKIEATDRNWAEVTKTIRNCVDAIASGGKSIADELASEIATQKNRKQELIVQRERLTQDLAACEGDILDEQRVCKSVERFGDILQGLSGDEKKALVGLFVQQIEVLPGAGDASLQQSGMRALELRFRLNVPRLVETMEERMTVGAKSGSPSIRAVALTVHVAITQQGRNSQSTVLAPFRYGDEPKILPPNESTQPARTDSQHPLHRALAWSQKLKKKPTLSLRDLARIEGQSPPTIIYHLRLLRLAPDIRKYLLGLRDPKGLYFFSLRRMMRLARLDPSEQRRIFNELRSHYEARTRLPQVPESNPVIRAGSAPKSSNGMRLG